MERGEEALPALQMAVDALPRDPVALTNLVQRSCKSEGAEAALRRVRPIAATGRLAARRVARALAKAHAYAAALEVLSPEDDDDPLVMLFRGECLFRVGRLEDAIEMFDRVPRNDPMALPAGLNRAQTALVLGDSGRARAALADVKRLQANGVDALLRTFEAIINVVAESPFPVEIREADRSAAVHIIRNVLRSALARKARGLVSSLSLLLRLAGLSDGKALCLVGKLAYLEGEYVFAGQCLSRAYALRGLDAEGCLIAAELHRLAQNYGESLLLYHAFVRTGTPGPMGAYMESASVALKQRHLDDAVAFLDAGLTFYPTATLLGKARERVAAVRDAAAGNVIIDPIPLQA
jgi:tetratricopeptide (TPR) repeat protein